MIFVGYISQFFGINFKMRIFGEIFGENLRWEILKIIYGWSSLRWSILALYCVSKNFAARCEMPRDTARSLSKNSRLEFLEFQKFLPGWSFIITFYGFLFLVTVSFCGPSLFFGFSRISQNTQKFAKMWVFVQTTGRVWLRRILNIFRFGIE